jgi:hypothetical protein
MTWRTGRKLGRTLYEQVGAEPSDDDKLLGLMDTGTLAEFVVHAMNTYETRAVTRADALRDAADAAPGDYHKAWLRERADHIEEGRIS